MTRARLKFASGEPIEFAIEDVEAYGPPIAGFRPWLGAVFASTDGRWIIRFADDTVLGFRRDEIKRVRVTADGVQLTLGDEPEARTLTVRENAVVGYGPEPADVRSWLGRLAHGSGEAWVRLRDGTEVRFALGDGPHVSFLG